ncbi:MAG: flagellar export chaperone FliS [Fibrobacteres bacterium]|nr:flagellar export chaperone FliS [Fibrobacterota bacterium]
MSTTAYNTYKTANVATTDQGKLILICYDVAIKSCTQAKESTEKKDHIDRTKKIYKAQDAITELMVALNMEKGGEIAKRLYALYEYFNWRLSEGNIKQSVPMIEEVLRHLRLLRDAWVVAIDNTRKTGTTASPMPSAAAVEGKTPALSIVG